MKAQPTLIDLALKEWLLITAGASLVVTSLYNGRLPGYSLQEFQVLFMLLALFVAVNGLRRSGVILRVAQGLEYGQLVPLKLVTLTFFLSMIVTNDIALMITIPLTLSIRTGHKGLLVILEALAANAGSALTPFGNPQNLYLYWFYDIPATDFLAAIAPLSLAFLVLLSVAASCIRTVPAPRRSAAVDSGRNHYVYIVLLLVVILSVLHLLPGPSAGLAILFALLVDRKALRIDYSLLFTFFFFFGLAENIKFMLASELSHAGHVFILSALSSQLLGNVPATLLFAKFTTNWEALLWGANVGGFGSIFGSLANLIAYRLYVTHDDSHDALSFTVKFLIIGYAAFFLAMGLYWSLHGT